MSAAAIVHKGRRFGAMMPLDRSNIRWLVFHTEGSGARGRYGTADSIHRYHSTPEAKGGPPGGPWAGGGYHGVVGPDGKEEELRPEAYQGSHLKGMNQCSLGVVATGDGDLEAWTPAQTRGVVRWLARRCWDLGLPASACIGHREVNRLVREGKAPAGARTTKSCPGQKVNPEAIRGAVAQLLEQAKRHGAEVFEL